MEADVWFERYAPFDAEASMRSSELKDRVRTSVR